MRAAALAGAAVTSVALLGAVRRGHDARILRRLGIRSASGDGLVGAVGSIVARRLPLRTLRARLERLDAGDRLAVLVGRKTLLAVGGLVAGLLVAGGPLRAAVVLLLGAAGWRLPDFVAARRIRGSAERIEESVPDLLDGLALAVSAGLTPAQALDLGARSAPPLLGGVLDDCRRRVALGDRWPDALSGVAVRESAPSLGRLGRALARASRLGTPLGPDLLALAADARAARDLRCEERARRTPVLMLFPLVFCILPAFVLSAVLPAVLVATRGVI